MYFINCGNPSDLAASILNHPVRTVKTFMIMLSGLSYPTTLAVHYEAKATQTCFIYWVIQKECPYGRLNIRNSFSCCNISEYVPTKPGENNENNCKKNI